MKHRSISRASVRLSLGMMLLGFCAGVASAAPIESPVTSSPEPVKNESERTLQSERFGTLHVVAPASAPGSAVVLFSGDDGWSEEIRSVSISLAKQGTFVIGVETPAYRDHLAEDDEDCLYIGGEVERLSQSVQSGAKLAEYLRPTLVGFSSGASLAYVVLAQHGDAFMGGALFSFCPVFELKTNFCSDDHLTSRVITDGTRSRVILAPTPGFPLRLIVLQGEEDTTCRYERIKNFFTPMPSVHLSAIPGGTHELHQLDGFSEKLLNAIREVRDAARGDDPSALLASQVADLPLVEIPPSAPSTGDLVIFFSGDGGWATIDKEVGGDLGEHGLYVVGWSSLTYFWKSRGSEQLAKDLTRVLEFYSHKVEPKRIILMGYSMGADVIPFALNRLPEQLRKRVTAVVLIAPDLEIDFEVHITAWVGYDESESDRPILPELLRNHDIPLLCVAAAEELDESPCPALPSPPATMITLPGGHHFDGDYERLSSEIRRFLSPAPEKTPP